MNTRFNPTTNGPLHLGHIYMALVNEYMAHSTGGKFVVRFDDNTRYFLATLGGEEAMQCNADQQLNDLSVMGLKIDEVVYQSEHEERVKMFLASSRYQPVVDHAHEGTWDNAPIITVTPTISPQRPHSWITAEKVCLDRWWDVDPVIRGIELLHEHALYVYFYALLGFRVPKCYYLPRLMCTPDDGPISNVSKTMGNWKVADLLEAGFDKRGIMNLLRQSCLKELDGEWHVNNIKGTPRLPVERIEDL